MWALQSFLHQVAVAIWLGGSLTFMIWGPAARNASLESWAHTWHTLAKVQRALVAPAAAVATITGITMTMGLVKRDFDMGSATWLMVMQGFGLVAGLLTLGIATPLANRMALLARRSVEKGARDPLAERVRSRLALAGSVSGACILVAFYFGVARPS
jgi:uncharacterized membrane protein